ncbi:DsbE family thiol:disulfide interchange protein [Rhodophyticola sp. MJ-SS7]|nr:DsbE family thiol:disulfide interchange protein [Rhodophyticola sp. MJ-SS7]
MLLPPLLFAAIAAVFFVGMQRENPNVLPSAQEGFPAPPIDPIAVPPYPVFDQAALTADGIKVVNFWASWCAPCRSEHPNIMELAEEFPVYGVNRDITFDQARAFLDELGNPFDGVVHDPKNRQSIEWGVYALPETFFIDGNGNVILHYRGPITKRHLDERIRPAIDAATRGG